MKTKWNTQKSRIFGTSKGIKKISLVAFSVLAIGLIGSVGLASAYQGNPDDQGPNYDAALHDLKTDAFDTNDYEAWRFLMEDAPNQGRVLDVVNEENFNVFVQAHNAAMNGDMELSNELRSELGLNNGVGPADGTGYKNGGQGQGMHKGQGLQDGQGQGMNSEMQQAEFIDANGDGLCDNDGSTLGQQKGMGRNR